MIISRKDYTYEGVKRLTKNKSYEIVKDISHYNNYVIKDDTGEYFSFMTWRFYDAATARDKQIEKILWHI